MHSMGSTLLLDTSSIFYKISGERLMNLIPPELGKDEITVYARADGSIEVLAGKPTATDERRFLQVWGGTVLFEERRADYKRVLGFFLYQHDLEKPAIHQPDERFYPGQAHPGFGHLVSVKMVKRIETFGSELKEKHKDLVALAYPFLYFHEYVIFRYHLGFHLGDAKLYPQNKGIARRLREIEAELTRIGLRRTDRWIWHLREQSWYVFNQLHRFDLEDHPIMEKEL